MEMLNIWVYGESWSILLVPSVFVKCGLPQTILEHPNPTV